MGFKLEFERALSHVSNMTFDLPEVQCYSCSLTAEDNN